MLPDPLRWRTNISLVCIHRKSHFTPWKGVTTYCSPFGIQNVVVLAGMFDVYLSVKHPTTKQQLSHWQPDNWQYRCKSWLLVLLLIIRCTRIPKNAHKTRGKVPTITNLPCIHNVVSTGMNFLKYMVCCVPWHCGKNTKMYIRHHFVMVNCCRPVSTKHPSEKQRGEFLPWSRESSSAANVLLK